MRRPLVFLRLLFSLGLFLTGLAQAAPVPTIYLYAPNNVVTVGDLVAFELWMDFTGDPTIGGDFNISYNNFTDGNQLSLVSYFPYLGYDPAALGDSFLTSAPYPDVDNLGGDTMMPAPEPTATGLTGIAFGGFDGLEGPDLIGTLYFTANVEGGPYTLSAVAGGGFFSSTSALAQPVLFDNTGASVSVEPSPVPLPASFWLLGSAVAGVFSFRRVKA